MPTDESPDDPSSAPRRSSARRADDPARADDYEDAVFDAAEEQSSRPARRSEASPLDDAADEGDSPDLDGAGYAAVPEPDELGSSEHSLPAEPIVASTLAADPAGPRDEELAPAVYTTEDSPVRAEASLPVESIFHEDRPYEDRPLRDAYTDDDEQVADDVPEDNAAASDSPADGASAPGETPLPPPPSWWTRSMLLSTALGSAAMIVGTVAGLYIYNTGGIRPSAPEASPVDVEIREAERLAEEVELDQFGEAVSLDAALDQARKARDLAQSKKASPFDVGRAELLVMKLDKRRDERALKRAIEAIWFDEAAGASARIESGGREPVSNATRYQIAFREFGVPAQKTHSRDAADKILSLPKGLRDQAIAALDDWATQTDFPTHNWIGEVLSRVDQDHERMGVRLAVARGDRHAVERASGDGAILRQPTPQLFFVTRMLLEWSRPDAAVAMLQRAQAVRPRDFWVQHLLGVAALRQSPADAELASTAFTAAEALYPNAFTETQLGLAWLQLGRRDEAIACWQRALNGAPNYRDARLYLAEHGDPGRPIEEALASYDRLRRDYPFDPAASLAAGRYLVSQRRLEDALPMFEEAAHRGSSEAPADLARAYAALHRHSEAALAFEWALELTPDRYRLHAEAAQEYGMLNRLDEAFDHAKRCVLYAPGEIEGHIALVALYRRKHRPDDAIAAARAALAIDSRRADAWDALGLALTETGDSLAAIDAFERAVAIDPKFARAQSHLGSELAIAGRTAEAILPLQRAIRIDPADHVSRRNLAVLLERERRWGEAADAWSDVLAVEPLNAEARCNLAFALQQGGRFQDAAAEYTQAFADAPSLAEDLPSLRRYDAARSAAAAASRGTTPHDASVSKVEANPADLRRQSLEWLRADLVGWREQLAEDDQIDTRFAVANVLGHWLNEPTLDPIRSPTALAQLPADERAEWEALWKSVRRMRSDAVPDTAVSAKVPTRLLGPSRNTVAKPIIAP